MPITLLDPDAGVITDAPNRQMTVGANGEAGDLRLFRITASSSRTFPTVSGWSKLDDQVLTRRITLYSRVLTGSDSNVTVTPTSSPASNAHNMSWAGITLRGWDSTASLAPSTSGPGSSSSSVVAPSVATGLGLLLCWFDVTRVDGTAGTGSWGVPAGMSSVASSMSDYTMGYNVLLASEDRTSGASGTRTATAASAGTWSATSLFVPEAAVSGPPLGQFLPFFR